jgi:hypothetical protein
MDICPDAADPSPPPNQNAIDGGRNGRRASPHARGHWADCLCRQINSGFGATAGAATTLNHSRKTSAWFWSRDFSSGAAAAILPSLPFRMRGKATASGTRGLSRYGEFFISVCLTVWLEMPCPRSGGRRGSQPAVRQAGLFVLVSEAYLAAPPTQQMVRLSRGRSHSRFWP